MKILIVNQDYPTVIFLKHIFQKQGWISEVGTTYHMARIILREVDVDILIIDPTLSSHNHEKSRNDFGEFFATIDKPVMVVSSILKRNALYQGFGGLVEAWFEKPFSPTLLIREIERCVGNHRQVLSDINDLISDVGYEQSY